MLLVVCLNMFQGAHFALLSDVTCAGRMEGGGVMLEVCRGQSSNKSKTKV